MSAEKLPEKVARLCRTLLNSNRGIQCTQKLQSCTCRFLHSQNRIRKYGQYFTERKALTKPTSKEYRHPIFHKEIPLWQCLLPGISSDVVGGKSGRNQPTSRRDPIHIGRISYTSDIVHDHHQGPSQSGSPMCHVLDHDNCHVVRLKYTIRPLGHDWLFRHAT